MNLFKRLKPKTLRSKASLAIIVTAAVLVEATSAVQYWFAREGIRQEVVNRAESELKAKRLEIENVTTAVEVAAENLVWAVEAELSRPDSLPAIARRLVEQNKQIVGAAVIFVADYYPEYGRWCELYVAQRGDGRFETAQIGGPDHDYLNRDWFRNGIAAGHGTWSEPYYDDAGALMMLCSYFVPVRDRSGQTVALFGADVSLDWLSEIINARPIYPSSYNLLLSREGQIMACPVESLVMRQSAEQAAGMEDTTVSYINRQMLAGRSGQATVTGEKGEKKYVFYAQMDDDTGWSMAVVCADREIFYSLRQVAFNLFLLMLVGVALLGFIIWRTSKSARRLQAVNSEKERMGTELHIASEIQKGMLPKIFPPFPERDDVDIFATLVPAKEVGGDLYDFFIRDEKLFFCIGDVSGKGVPSSLVMAVTRSLFRTVSGNEDSPERIITQMNNAMAEMNDANMFVTLFLGVLDLPTGRLRFCNAGHCPPLLLPSDNLTNSQLQAENSPIVKSSNNPIVMTVKPNLPIGMIEGWKYEGQETLVSPQTTIFLYTDGLTEAENIMHGQFGKQRMMKELKGASAPNLVIERMTAAVHAYVGDAEQSDDLTMLAIKYTKVKEA